MDIARHPRPHEGLPAWNPEEFKAQLTPKAAATTSTTPSMCA